MNDILTAVWTALTTTNEELINILLIPCNYIEITITMLLFTTILKISVNKKQKIIYVLLFATLNIITNYIIPNPFKVILNLLLSPILVYLIFKTTILKAILSEIIPIVIGTLIETIILKIYYLAFGISNDIAYFVPLYRILFMVITYLNWFILYKICKHKNINITILDSMNKRTKILLILNSIFMIISFALQSFLVSFYIDNLPLNNMHCFII